MAKEKVYTRKTESLSSTGSAVDDNGSELLFGKKNYTFILIGVGLIFLGFVLMSGGHMSSPDVWDESLIYSPRRITLAPMCILAGLIVSVYAIFIREKA